MRETQRKHTNLHFSAECDDVWVSGKRTKKKTRKLNVAESLQNATVSRFAGVCDPGEEAERKAK